VARDATPAEIHRAYVVRARALHPDTGGPDADERAMQVLNEAWAVLRDPRRRWEYDVRTGAVPPRPTFVAGPAGGDPGAADVADDDADGGPTADVAFGGPARGGRLGDLVLLVPVGLFAAGVATIAFAAMTLNAGLVALAFGLLVLSGAAFVVSPFLALARQRGRRFRWR
jgi:curved DNA-binding protein CbpA